MWPRIVCLLILVILASRTERAVAQRARGIDVSTYQGTVNWTSVRAAGKTFAWARATIGTGTDATFTNNSINAKAAGVLIGAYHYARPDLDLGTAGAVTEANHFWSVARSFISGSNTYLMPVLDIEQAPGVSYTKTTLSQWINTWCSNVVALAAAQGVTVKPFVYSYISYANNWLNSSVTVWPLWMANNYSGQNTETGGPSSLGPWNTWVFWQYGIDPVSGVSNDVDVDVFNGTLAQMSPYVVGGLTNRVSVGVKTNAAEPSAPGQFNITRSPAMLGAITVNYSISGTASNGVDYVALSGTATIASGQTNVLIAIMPINDTNAEPTETIKLTIAPGTGYVTLTPTSATMNLLDDDLGTGSVASYLFNENDNKATSLAAVAAASVNLNYALHASNAVAGAGLGLFGRNNVAGVGHGYATSQYYSSPSTLYCRGDYLGTNATQAISDNDYLSFTLGPEPGYALSLTNFSVRLKMPPATGQTSWVFLRSSADNFATTIASFTVPGTDMTSDPWPLWNAPLAMTNLQSDREFRVYLYGSRVSGGDIARLDDAVFSGSVTVIPPAVPNITGIVLANGNVEISFTAATGDAPADFLLQSANQMAGSFADDNTAAITGLGAGQFKAVTTAIEETQYYRLVRQ